MDDINIVNSTNSEKIFMTHREVKILHNDLKILHKRNTLLSIIFSFSIMLIVIFAIWAIFFSKINIIKESRIKAAKYDILKPTGEYNLLLNQIKRVERGMRTIMIQCGREYSSTKRMNDREFEEYTTLIYMAKYLDNLDINLFIANTSSESCWNKNAKSKVGAIGLNQIMPRTFKWMNEFALFKFKTDIWDIWDNTEASISYWIFNRELLRYKLNREPKKYELAWAYNTGAENVLKAINSGEPKNYLDPETINHGKKAIYYYSNYLEGYYDVWWEKKYYKQSSN